VAERLKRYREASVDREAGVVFRFENKTAAAVGKPPRLRQLRWLRDIFINDPATPPSLEAARCRSSTVPRRGRRPSIVETRL